MALDLLIPLVFGIVALLIIAGWDVASQMRARQTRGRLREREDRTPPLTHGN